MSETRQIEKPARRETSAAPSTTRPASAASAAPRPRAGDDNRPVQDADEPTYVELVDAGQVQGREAESEADSGPRVADHPGTALWVAGANTAAGSALGAVYSLGPWGALAAGGAALTVGGAAIAASSSRSMRRYRQYRRLSRMGYGGANSGGYGGRSGARRSRLGRSGGTGASGGSSGASGGLGRRGRRMRASQASAGAGGALRGGRGGGSQGTYGGGGRAGGRLGRRAGGGAAGTGGGRGGRLGRLGRSARGVTGSGLGGSQAGGRWRRGRGASGAGGGGRGGAGRTTGAFRSAGRGMRSAGQRMRSGSARARMGWVRTRPRRTRVRRGMFRAVIDTLLLPIGLVAGVLGLILGVVHGKPELSWRAFAAVFNARSRRAAAVAAVAAADRDETVPQLGDDAPLPGQASAGDQSGPDVGAADLMGGTMSLFARAGLQVAEDYRRYSPPTMMAVAAEYNGLVKGIASVRRAVDELVQAHDGWAVDPAVRDRVQVVHDVLADAEKQAGEVPVLFRQLHAPDLARHATPRAGFSGESMWNVGGRPGDGAGEGKQSRFATSCEEVEAVYKGWSPESMMEHVAVEYAGLPVGLDALADAVSSLATRSADCYPVEGRVSEEIGAVARLLRRASSASAEVVPTFRRAHAVDISHHEEPRNGRAAEAMWNV